MRVVLDTNTLVSALLSPNGPPRSLLDKARGQVFELCSSPVLMAELLDVAQLNSLSELIYREAQRLPENLAGEVYDFIRFVEQRHGISTSDKPRSDWSDFFARHGRAVDDPEPLDREAVYADRLR